MREQGLRKQIRADTADDGVGRGGDPASGGRRSRKRRRVRRRGREEEKKEKEKWRCCLRGQRCAVRNQGGKNLQAEEADNLSMQRTLTVMTAELRLERPSLGH